MRYKKPAIDISLEPNSIISNIELELVISKNDNTESYKNINSLIPATIQQLVISGEQSGNIAGTFIKIGEMYEVKTETTVSAGRSPP